MHRSGIFDSRSLLGGTITIYIRGVYLERAEREEEASGQRYPFIWVSLARVKPIARRFLTLCYASFSRRISMDHES